MRTPLNAILGYTNLASSAGGLSEKDGYLEKIGSAGNLMAAAKRRDVRALRLKAVVAAENADAVAVVAGGVQDALQHVVEKKLRHVGKHDPDRIGALGLESARDHIDMIATDNAFVAGFGKGTFLGLSYLTYIFILVAIIAILVMKYTQFGRNLYATGGNAVAASLSGVNINFYRFIVFVILGFAAGLAASMQRWWTHSKPCFLHHSEGVYYDELREIFYTP